MAKEKGTDKTTDAKVQTVPAAPWAPVVAEVKTDPVVAPDNEATADVMDESPEGVTPPAIQDAGINESTEKASEPVVIGMDLAAPETDRTISGEVIEMVTVTAPKDFKLVLDHFREVQIKAGIQEMERAWAEHWWSKANGVTIYTPSKK